MMFSPTCLLPPWRSIGSPGRWSSVLAYPYSTSAILQSPSPLMMDAQNVYNREWRKKNKESTRRSDIKWLQENRAKRREWERTKYERSALYTRFSMYLRRYDWTLQHFSWKTHIPIKTKEKIKRACSSCGRYEAHGLRLWWKRRISEPPTTAAYDCFECFRRSNPEHVVPIEYEGLSLEDAFGAMREARKQHAKSVGETTASLSKDDKPH
jgi:hypothetical protein